MTDLAALDALIQADAETRGAPISRLGYFCAPFRPPDGPFADRVIKVYQGLSDPDQATRLARCHDDYVAALQTAGVPMPDTAFHLRPLGGGRVPVVVQRALPADSLMRPLMQAGTRDDTLAMLEAAGQVIARFWRWEAATQTPRIGFHPSIRNFAILDGQAIFFDTFPPLIHYSRNEMGQMLLTFSEKRLMRLVGPLLRARVTAIQDEWYSPAETLVGLVGSACRLRPEHTQDYLDWGRSFARGPMAPWQAEIDRGLATPPKLGGLWTGMRKALGLEGEPDLPR